MNVDKSQANREIIQNGEPKKLFQCLATAIVCFGTLSCGQAISWTSNISDDLLNGKLNNISVTETQLEWITSSMIFGSIITCLIAGYLSDAIGRKLTMLLSVVPAIIGWLLIVFAETIEMVYSGRFLTGACAGIFIANGPLYITEIAHKDIRGILANVCQFHLGFASFLSSLVGAFVSPRDLAVFGAISPFILAIGLLFLPETPMYLLRKNRDKAANKVLNKLRGADYNTNEEISEMKQVLSDMSKGSAISLWDSLQKTETKKSFVISFGLIFFQQMSGLGALLFYTKLIFESAGTNLKSSDATIIVGAATVLSAFLSSFVIDRFGRKTLLIFSNAIVGLSTILLGAFFTMKERVILSTEEMANIGFLPIVGLVMFVMAYAVGLGPIPGLMAAEVFPPEMKSKGCAAGAALSLCMTFLMAQFYLSVSRAIQADTTFYIFALVAALGVAFVFFVCPETKGKSLAMISLEMKGSRG